MTDDVFERRTRRFEEVLGILEGLAETPWARFTADPEKYGSTERFLQLAVEVLDDLGAHVVARAGAGPVASYGDVPARLLEAGHLTEPQARTWRRIIGFRNVLVHDYLEVDLTIVYDVLRNRLDDLRDLHRTLLAAHRRLG
jgi:uncharacterized protein YutE (UPF0331/DUF86 family)